jgi:hypothetical protein
VAADEPYDLLEEQGYEFGFPPTLEDYRALLACSLRSLSPPLLPGVVFDRTPLDYLAYMAATGADPCDEADAAMLRPALDLVYDDPVNAWADIPVLELSGPLDGRLNAVLAALNGPGTLTHRDQTPGTSPIAP